MNSNESIYFKLKKKAASTASKIIQQILYPPHLAEHNNNKGRYR